MDFRLKSSRFGSVATEPAHGGESQWQTVNNKIPSSIHEIQILIPVGSGDPDLEAGGGVKPGHTPPDSQSATDPGSQSATDTPQHDPPARPPRSKATLTIMIVIAVLLVLVFVAYAIGLWD